MHKKAPNNDNQLEINKENVCFQKLFKINKTDKLVKIIIVFSSILLGIAQKTRGIVIHNRSGSQAV